MSVKPAARVTDPTFCPLPGHGTSSIATGSGNVFINGLAAARQGDVSTWGGALLDGLAATVLINGKPAATLDSFRTHGNRVVEGAGTVLVGNSHSPSRFSAFSNSAAAAVFSAAAACSDEVMTPRVI